MSNPRFPARPPAAALGILALAALFASCSYRYEISVEPDSATLSADGAPRVPGERFAAAAKEISVRAEAPGRVPWEGNVEAAGLFRVARRSITLAPVLHRVTVDALEPGSTLAVDGGAEVGLPATLELAEGPHVLELRRADRPAQRLETAIDRPRDFLFRHLPAVPEAPGLRLVQLGVARTGRQPKSVVFAPDSKTFVVNLLDGEGFEAFDAATLARLGGFGPPASSKARGFVEGVFVPATGEYFVSQMTSGRFFRYDASRLAEGVATLGQTLDAHGAWTKVIAYAPATDTLALSNWLSNDVTLFDRATGAYRGRIAGVPVPRGLAFSPDGSILYVTSYDGGLFLEFRVADGKELARIARAGSNMRHVVLSADGASAWVSDMGLNSIYEVSLAEFRAVATLRTSINPNTIDLAPEGDLLFVSTRGPNNPGGYLLRSLKPGTVEVFDVRSRTRVLVMEGGTQPTGLDVSPDGALLAYTNFQDDTVELYRVERTP